MLESVAPTSSATTPETPVYPEIKSYVLRTGRLTEGQQKAIDVYGDEHIIAYEALTQFPAGSEQVVAYLQSRFPQPQPLVLEIGFGMGTSLVAMAKANPHYNYLGIEVHVPGVGACLKTMVDEQVTNLKVISHDAIEVLKALPENTLAGLQLYFPDPWPKARHHKRRIVKPSFMNLIVPRLASQGFIHMATDWQNYAEQMLEVLSNTAGISNTSATNDYIPRPDYRPLTKFEQRGQRLGHGIWDLYFLKD